MSETLGVDLGGTNIVCGVIDDKGRVNCRNSRETDASEGKERVLSNILECVDGLARRPDFEKICAIGVGTPGAVESGVVIGGAENIPGWEDVALVRMMEERFQKPAFASNDVTLYALGEAKYGAGVGAKNVVCLALGTGIGGGVVINGELFHGSSDCAAEVGHMTINVDGVKCNCGGFGCLECYASATAVVRAGKEAAKANPESLILALAGGKPENITARGVFNAAKKGDEPALKVVREAGRYLGAGIGNLINLFNPEVVIIGGGMSQAGEIILEVVDEAVKTYAMKINRRGVKIVLARLGDVAGIIGAGVFARMELEKRGSKN